MPRTDHDDELDEEPPRLRMYPPLEALARARPLPKDFGMDDLTQEESDAFMEAMRNR